jgi:hypothetical protein
MTVTPRGDAFYYADGSAVRLAPTDLTVVDLEAARAGDVPRSLVEGLQADGRQVRGSLTMVEQDALTPDLERRLRAAGAVRPVFRAEDGALIVVLPEVRVEATNAEEVTRVRRLVEATPVKARIVERRPQQLSIQLDEADGIEALDLANRIEEEIHPALSQARFVRIVRRPGADV